MIFNPFSVLTSKIFGGFALSLAIVASVQSCRLERVTHQRDDARDIAKGFAALLDATVASYRAAAAEADRAQQANLVRVKVEREAVFERKVHELQNARAAADARYRRLLASAAEADTRGAGDADLSAVADATCRAYAGAACHDIPPLLKAAQDNTDQLIGLQGAIREQAAIVTSPAPRSTPAD